MKPAIHRLLWGISAVLMTAASILLLVGDGKIAVREKIETATDPINGTYLINGMKITLHNGSHEMEAAPGSATKIKTRLHGPLVSANLNDDSQEDAALILIHDPGGSGTFYYVAAAVNVDGLYQGTNAVLLGDRISPQNLQVRHGLISASYYDRRSEEPMIVPPSVARSKHLIIEKNELKEIETLEAEEQIWEGWVVVGHEVRSFSPCPGNREHWLLGDSPALKRIRAAYGEALPKARPYAPLFMILVGRPANPPNEGFGADYDLAFFATQFVRVWARGNCKSDLIYLESPLPGEFIDSPLEIHGYARGTWFFEGDFPVFILDSREQIIAAKFATAQKDWMTDKFIPFAGTITFEKPESGGRGILILKKNNPTGYPEHDDVLEIPVSFE
jgi:hypothetical protein